MAVISDSSPLIIFSRARRLDLLQRLFTQIIIPAGVRDEIAPPELTLPGAHDLAGASWIKVEAVPVGVRAGDALAQLGRGEREAIALARLAGERLALLIDDRAARRLAASMGLQVFGSAGVLVLAKERGHLTEVRPELDRLLAAGLYLAAEVYRAVLLAAAEAP